MKSGALELLSPTRRMLVNAVKERGKATAEELAAANYLSVAAVRMHLAALERLGILAHTRRSRGPGRPQHIYHLTEAGEQLFPQGYAPMLRNVMKMVAGDPECAEKFWNMFEDGQVAALGPKLAGLPIEEQVRKLVETGRNKGFEPVLTQTGKYSWTVEVHHCPVVRLAQDSDRLCQAEANVAERLLGGGATVRLEGTRARGGVSCRFTVRAPGPN